MYITWLEMKKALLSPVILILLLLMLALNLFLIISNSHHKEELKIVNDIVETYGLAFDDEVLATMEGDLLKSAQQLGGTDTAAFLEAMTYEKYEQANVSDQKQIDEISLKFTYLQVAKGLEARYEAIDLSKEKEAFLQQYAMPGWLEKKMVAEFNDWESRYDEIVAKNEYKKWFFLSNYRMHSELFRTHMKTLAVEGVLLVVLLTAFITNYEFEHRTQLVIYPTKKGRKLLLNKGLASLLASFIVLTVLFGGTLATYFTVYDYSTVWQASISSGFNWEYQLPYITWWDLSVGQYFVLALGILLVVLIIVVLLTYAIAVFVKNSYYTWIIGVLLLMAMFIVPAYFSNSVILWLSSFNISMLLMNPHEYFDGGRMFMETQYHEVWTLVIWLSIASIAVCWAIHYFNRKDVM
ncbi:hypothetical protein [Rummeliibacillus sp. TYF005]|uniref:hypothetical protein n=1 Tax=Rummeliibacillus sp. TYF005 TaxID=2058214 RepID=UPI000F52C187|nr:hypothetical protein [Rummeliibacillus sp. TYF005]